MNGRAGGDAPPFACPEPVPSTGSGQAKGQARGERYWGYGLFSFAMIFLFMDKFQGQMTEHPVVLGWKQFILAYRT
jgi:hypothetical protein